MRVFASAGTVTVAVPPALPVPALMPPFPLTVTTEAFVPAARIPVSTGGST